MADSSAYGQRLLYGIINNFNDDSCQAYKIYHVFCLPTMTVTQQKDALSVLE